MSIGQIQGDGGINPLKDQHPENVAKAVKSEVEKDKGKVGEDSVELSDRAKLFQEINKYKKELENISDPNEGRINELKESIAEGTLINDKTITETAQRLVDRLFS